MTFSIKGYEDRVTFCYCLWFLNTLWTHHKAFKLKRFIWTITTASLLSVKVFSWDNTWNTIFWVFLYITLGILSWNAELGIHTLSTGFMTVLTRFTKLLGSSKEHHSWWTDFVEQRVAREMTVSVPMRTNKNSRVWNWLVDYFWISSQNKTPPVPPTSGLRSPAVSPRKLSPFRQTTGHKKGAKRHKFSPETGDWRWKQERH